MPKFLGPVSFPQADGPDYISNNELNALEGINSNIQTQLDGKIDSTEKSSANGVATLGGDGLVPESQLPQLSGGSSGIAIPIRQAIVQGKTNFLNMPSRGDINIDTSQGSDPIILYLANGFSSGEPVDSKVTIGSDVNSAWSSITDTSYLYINSDGSYGSNSIPPLTEYKLPNTDSIWSSTYVSDFCISNTNEGIIPDRVTGSILSEFILSTNEDIYLEVTINSSTGAIIGIAKDWVDQSKSIKTSDYSWTYAADGNYHNGMTSNSAASTYTDNDVIGIAYSPINNKLWFSVNNSWDGDPTAGTGQAFEEIPLANLRLAMGESSGATITINNTNTYSPPTGYTFFTPIKSGQDCFIIPEMKMYNYNGTSWSNLNRLYIGEVYKANAVFSMSMEDGLVDDTYTHSDINFDSSGAPNFSTTTYKFGTQSLELDGIDDYISTSSNFMSFGLDDFTIQAWCYTGNYTLSTNPRCLLSFSDDSEPHLKLRLYDGSSISPNLSVSYMGNNLITGDINIADSSWHHISLIRSNNQLKLFIDGVQSGSTATGYYYLDSGGFILGADKDSGGFFDGFVDDFQIYREAIYDSTSITVPTAQSDISMVNGVIPYRVGKSYSTEVRVNGNIDYSIADNLNTDKKIVTINSPYGRINNTRTTRLNTDINYAPSTVIKVNISRIF